MSSLRTLCHGFQEPLWRDVIEAYATQRDHKEAGELALLLVTLDGRPTGNRGALDWQSLVCLERQEVPLTASGTQVNGRLLVAVDRQPRKPKLRKTGNFFWESVAGSEVEERRTCAL